MRVSLLALFFFFCSFIAFNPKSTPSASSKEIVFQSNDDGSHWSDISAGLPKDISPQCFHANSSELLLGSENGVYRKKTASMWQKDLFMDENIQGFLTIRSQLYGRSYQSGLFQELGNMSSWVKAYLSLNDKYVKNIYEAKDGALFSYSDLGIFKSIDSGKSWSGVYTGEIVQSFIEIDKVYIANAGRGLIRSIDSGKSWTKVANADMIYNMLVSDGILLACGDNGLYRSEDKGASWHRIISAYGRVNKIQKIDGRLVMNSSGQKNQNEIIGPLSNKVSHMHYSVDNGKTWKNMDEKIAINNYVNQIVKHGKFIFCSHEKGISRTADWGKTWELVLTAPEKMGFQMNVNGNVIYCMKVPIYGC